MGREWMDRRQTILRQPPPTSFQQRILRPAPHDRPTTLRQHLLRPFHLLRDPLVTMDDELPCIPSFFGSEFGGLGGVEGGEEGEVERLEDGFVAAVSMEVGD